MKFFKSKIDITIACHCSWLVDIVKRHKFKSQEVLIKLEHLIWCSDCINGLLFWQLSKIVQVDVNLNVYIQGRFFSIPCISTLDHIVKWMKHNSQPAELGLEHLIWHLKCINGHLCWHLSNTVQVYEDMKVWIHRHFFLLACISPSYISQQCKSVLVVYHNMYVHARFENILTVN